MKKKQKKTKKNMFLCDSKRSSLITDFFELQFDTATLIIQSFRMIKARGCKQKFKSDILYVITDDKRRGGGKGGAAVLILLSTDSEMKC